MICRVIATPATTGTGDYKGWIFSKDSGRSLNVGEIRFVYNTTCKDSIDKILRQAMRDYKASIDEYWKQYRRGTKTLQYTQAMRAIKTANDKLVRDAKLATNDLF